MTHAFHAGDLEGVMASYESTATIVFEPGQPVGDDSAQRAAFAQFFAVNPRFEYGAHEVLIAGDIAVHTAPWTMRGTAPDGSPIEQNGLSVAVLRRQKNGEWKMVVDNPHGSRLLD